MPVFPSLECCVQTGSVSRYGWVDIAKGICIVAVVCYYANTYLGYMRPDTGWLAHWAQFARPFRMPDFFLLSGLFLSRVIDRPWRSYLDTKVVHYAYFLVLWSALYFAWRVGSGELQTTGAVPLLKHYIYFLIHPMAALWFIQTLAAFFVVTRLLRSVPTFVLVALAAAGMLSRFHTGFSPVDNFLEYYVFFVIGARLAEPLFHWADAAGRQPRLALAGFGVWVLLNLWVTGQGWNKLQGVDLPWSMVCILAVIALSRLLSESKRMCWASCWSSSGSVLPCCCTRPLAATPCGSSSNDRRGRAWCRDAPAMQWRRPTPDRLLLGFDGGALRGACSFQWTRVVPRWPISISVLNPCRHVNGWNSGGVTWSHAAMQASS